MVAHGLLKEVAAEPPILFQNLLHHLSWRGSNKVDRGQFVTQVASW